MATSNPEDPFLEVQTDVLSTLQNTRPLFSSYKRIRSLATSATNPEFQQARSELETTLQYLTADLADLVESVRAIESDPYRYGLEIEEVERRRKLVQDVGGELETMKSELRKAGQVTGTGSATSTTSTTAGATVPGAGALPNPAEFDEDGDTADYYAGFEQQRQMELMHAQDEQLDGVFRTVGTLREQADVMGRELEDQVGLLDDVDNLADRVGGKLQSGIKRIGQIVRKNEDTMSSFCIAILIFVLFLLLILVIVV